MKIRSGFVSNSSSSSFTIHRIDDDEYEKYKLTLENGMGSDEEKALIAKVEEATGQPMYGLSHEEFFWEKLMSTELKNDFEFRRQIENYTEIKFPFSFSISDILYLIEEKKEVMKGVKEDED